jgi:hypothetical protein
MNAQVDEARALMMIALCAGMLALPLPAASQSAPAGNADAGRQLFVRKAASSAMAAKVRGRQSLVRDSGRTRWRSRRSFVLFETHARRCRRTRRRSFPTPSSQTYVHFSTPGLVRHRSTRSCRDEGRRRPRVRMGTNKALWRCEQSVNNFLPNTRRQQDRTRATGTKNQQDSEPASIC